MTLVFYHYFNVTRLAVLLLVWRGRTKNMSQDPSQIDTQAYFYSALNPVDRDLK